MMAEYRYVIDVTKRAMEQYPNFHVIIDSHAGDQIVALCPITEGNEPVCEGDYSFAPLVQRALENLAKSKADLANLTALVRSAFVEGRESMSMKNPEANARAWDNSGARLRVKTMLTGVREPDEFEVHPMGGSAPDVQIVISPEASPLDRMIAHGRHAIKDA